MHNGVIIMHAVDLIGGALTFRTFDDAKLVKGGSFPEKCEKCIFKNRGLCGVIDCEGGYFVFDDVSVKE